MEIFKEYTFEAAHFLPNVPPGHKCHEMHGHTYRVVVYVEGPVDPTTGFVCDFADISQAMATIYGKLDHQLLNNTIDNPTCEVLAEFLFNWLRQHVPVSRIKVCETPTSGCEYRG